MHSGRILLVPNVARQDIVATVAQVVNACATRGIAVRMVEGTSESVATGAGVETVPDIPEAAEGCELVLVLGGDGTFLRAAELARPAEAPLLGINLGKVGFLAQAEVDDIDQAVSDIVAASDPEPSTWNWPATVPA